jgi:hypothetical protein
MKTFRTPMASLHLARQALRSVILTDGLVAFTILPVSARKGILLYPQASTFSIARRLLKQLPLVAPG